MNKKAILTGSALLASSRILQRLLAFARNVVVARLVTPEDFGLAATFWITTAFLRTITELGFEQWIVQEKDGDSEQAGAVLQSLYLVRGGLLAAILVVTASPISIFFHTPEISWAFATLAVIPLVQGFQHRDVERVKRHLRFGPSVTVLLVPEVVVILATLPLVWYLRDYRVFLFAAILNVLVSVVISHLIAERKFRLGWSTVHVQSCLRFGWPLLLNSLLMYLSLQGDRILLAQFFSKGDLGAYSVAAALITSTIGMAISIINPIVFPLMCGVRDNPQLFERYFRLHIYTVTIVAIYFGMTLVVVGPLAIHVLYGSKYGGAAVVVGWLGVAESIRLLRGPASNLAMSRGDTMNTFYANLARLSGFALAFLFAWLGKNITWIAMSCVAGELISLLVTSILLKVRHAVNIQPLLKSALALFAAVVASIACQGALRQSQSAGLEIVLLLALCAVTTWLYFRSFPEALDMLQRALPCRLRMFDQKLGLVPKE